MPTLPERPPALFAMTAANLPKVFSPEALARLQTSGQIGHAQLERTV